jgi:hypothetical protein
MKYKIKFQIMSNDNDWNHLKICNQSPLMFVEKRNDIVSLMLLIVINIVMTSLFIDLIIMVLDKNLSMYFFFID